VLNLDPADPGGTMRTMSEFQQIEYNDEVVAVVVGDQAIIPKGLPAADRHTVKAMCLYALEVIAGTQPRPYSTEQALQYADRAAAAAAQRPG
jgi:hypothetical protein